MIILDAGHGGRDPGTSYSDILEKDLALDIDNKIASELKRQGFKVERIRDKDVFLDSGPRAAKVKNSGAKICISSHINSGGGMGCEVLISQYNDGKLAREIIKQLGLIGLDNKRGTKTRKLKNGQDYYYMHRLTGNVTTLIVEYGFMDTKKDREYLINANNRTKCAKAVVKAICIVEGIKYKENISNPSAPNKIAISGKSIATAKQMEKLLLSKNKSPKISFSAIEFAQIFIEEGNIEGIRGDIAFCQSMHETGWLKFGGQVLPEQNNYAGIGATNNSPVGKGAWFEYARSGIRAQIQHLKAYANKEPLKQVNVDPRFNLVTRGIAPNWTDLNGRWAVPGTTYGQSILAMYEELLKVVVYETTNNNELDKLKEEVKRLSAELKDKEGKLSSIKDIVK